jgi:hypothetical protein
MTGKIDLYVIEMKDGRSAVDICYRTTLEQQIRTRNVRESGRYQPR